MQKKFNKVRESTKEMKTLSRKLNANGLVGFQAELFEQNFPKQYIGTEVQTCYWYTIGDIMSKITL